MAGGKQQDQIDDQFFIAQAVAPFFDLDETAQHVVGGPLPPLGDQVAEVAGGIPGLPLWASAEFLGRENPAIDGFFKRHRPSPQAIPIRRRHAYNICAMTVTGSGIAKIADEVDGAAHVFGAIQIIRDHSGDLRLERLHSLRSERAW